MKPGENLREKEGVKKRLGSLKKPLRKIDFCLPGVQKCFYCEDFRCREIKVKQ